MNRAANVVEQTLGGSVIKQGSENLFGFVFRDENGVIINIQGASVIVKIANEKIVVLEKTATVTSDNVVTFLLANSDVTGHGEMRIEFIVTYSDGTKQMFPADGWQKVIISPSLDNAEVGGISYVTVETIKADIQSFKNEVNPLVDEAVTKSNNAELIANSVQTQFDVVTGASTIDPAVEQMKTSSDGSTVFNSPDERVRTEVNTLNAHLAETVPLPEWLKGSIRDVLKQLDDYIRQFGINVRQAPYNAPADGNSHPLSERFTTLEEAQAIFTAATSLTDEIDWAAIQTAFNKASNTGNGVYAPNGRYKTNKPLVVKWTATPESGLPSRPKISCFVGDKETSIEGTITEVDRAILEIVGESNSYSANMRIADFTLRMKGGNSGAYCLRVGDAKDSFNAERIRCHGANGLILKVSNGSWAQMCTNFTSCSFRSNYGKEWFADEALAEVYAVKPEVGTSRWDNVKFESCLFNGLVETRASTVNFDSCQFLTPTDRPNTTKNFANNVSVRIGNASFNDCYFEDHHTAIEINPTAWNVNFVSVENCRFSGVNNTAGFLSQYAIDIVNNATYKAGKISVKACQFGDIDSDGTRFYEQASIRNSNPTAVLEMDGLTNYYKRGTPIKVINNVTNFSNRDGEIPTPLRAEKIIFNVVLNKSDGIEYPKVNNIANINYFGITRESWISKITVMIDGKITAGNVGVRVLKNGSTSFLNDFVANYIKNTGSYNTNGEYGYLENPNNTLVFKKNDVLNLQIVLSNGYAPLGKNLAIEVELAY